MGQSENNPKISQRYQRYLPVITFVAQQQNVVDVNAVKDHCSEEKPAFVTRLVNQLVSEGWLVREPDENQYRWNEDRGEFSVQRWIDDKLFGMQVKVAPEQERPRERLLHLGAEQLTNSELIAVLVRSGLPGESAVMAGRKAATEFHHRLEDLPKAGRAELKNISPAIGEIAYCQIMAGIELGRRIAAISEERVTTKICSSAEAIVFCRSHFKRLTIDARQEEFHIVTLDTKNQVIDTHQITKGTLDASLVHPREVFLKAIRDAAASVILVHNHPSGDPTPSREDFAVTDRLEQSGTTLGIDVLDHIVLGRETAVSIREAR